MWTHAGRVGGEHTHNCSYDSELLEHEIRAPRATIALVLDWMDLAINVCPLMFQHGDTEGVRSSLPQAFGHALHGAAVLSPAVSMVDRHGSSHAAIG